MTSASSGVANPIAPTAMRRVRCSIACRDACKRWQHADRASRAPPRLRRAPRRIRHRARTTRARAQLAQSAQHGTAHERLGPFGPSAQHGARCRVLQFGQALRGGGARRRPDRAMRRSASTTSGCSHAPSTRAASPRTSADGSSRSGDERGYEPGVLEVGEFEQCDATHGGIGRGEAGDECGFVGGVCARQDGSEGGGGHRRLK